MECMQVYTLFFFLQQFYVEEAAVLFHCTSFSCSFFLSVGLRCSSVSLLEQGQSFPISTHSETIIRRSTPNPRSLSALAATLRMYHLHCSLSRS